MEQGTVFFWNNLLNRRPRSLRTILLVSRIRRGTFEMAHCDTPVIRNISLWERKPTTRELRTMISIIKCRILVEINATYVSDGNLLTSSVHSWMRSSQMRHTSFGAIGEICILFFFKFDRDWAKVMIDNKILSECRERSFYLYYRWASIDKDFHQAKQYHWYGDSIQLVSSVLREVR